MRYNDTFIDETPVPDYASRLRLDGRVVVVLGAGQGIGRQVAHAAAAAGATVCCGDLAEARATRVAEEVGGVAWTGDVTRREEVQRLFDELEETTTGVTDVVDIVGDATWAALLDVEDEDWDRQFALNLRHAFYAMQIGARTMAAGGRSGAMAFVASPDGAIASPLHAPYGAAKAGLISLVQTGAIELAPLGIRVNAIGPGSALTAGHPRSAQSITQYESIIPLGRMQDATDMASVLLFLLSDLARNITGQMLFVDGGLSVKPPLPRDAKSIAAMLNGSADAPR
jgi:NAD(P)-dependent dehydrogenase (short-subunit alcohol dehydrogenase family)